MRTVEDERGIFYYLNKFGHLYIFSKSFFAALLR